MTLIKGVPAAFQVNEETKLGVIPHARAWFTRNNPDTACHTACYNLLRRLAGLIFENNTYCVHREFDWNRLVSMLVGPKFKLNEQSLMMELSKLRSPGPTL